MQSDLVWHDSIGQDHTLLDLMRLMVEQVKEHVKGLILCYSYISIIISLYYTLSALLSISHKRCTYHLQTSVTVSSCLGINGPASRTKGLEGLLGSFEAVIALAEPHTARISPESLTASGLHRSIFRKRPRARLIFCLSHTHRKIQTPRRS